MAIDEEVVAETNGVNSSFIGQQEENKNQEGDPHDASLRKSFMSLSPQKTQIEKTKGEGGVVAETFYGQLSSFIKYKDTNGQEQMVKKKEEPFAEILLNVIGIKDLYESWENMYQNAIEDYETENVMQIGRAHV